MDTASELAGDGLVDAAKSQPAELAPEPGGDGVSKRGRPTKEEEIKRYLESQGLVTVPAAHPVPLVARAPFDETATRAGIEVLVNVASDQAHDSFADEAEPIVGPGAAESFGQRAEIKPAVKTGIVENGVAIARKHGVTIGPESSLVALVGSVVLQWRSLRKDLRRLAASKPAETQQ